MYIIKRTISQFNLDLEFDGEKVDVKAGDEVIDSHEVQGFKNGAQKMRGLEDEMHKVCQAMS